MLPEGWRKEKLGAVAEFQRGFDLPQSQRSEGSVPIISSSGASGFHDTAKALAPGIVTGRYGSIGDVFYVEEAYWPLNTALWVKDFHGNYPKYLYYLLSNFDFSKFSDKTGVPGVNRNDLHAVNVLVPPLPEQKKIAAILSTWDRAIEGTEKLLANSQQQKKALMQQLLTGKKRLPGFTGEWRNTSLYEICTLNPKSPKIEELTQISFIPMDGVSNDARISDVTTRAFKKENNGFSYFQKKDVLVAKITPCFENGKGGYLNALPTQHGFGSTEFHVLRATADADGKFIYYITTSERFRILGEMNMQGSAGQKRVPKDFIERFSVNLPPLPEQKAIAAVLTTADEEITAIESDLLRLRQEKKALMQQLLTGKRRVTVD